MAWNAAERLIAITASHRSSGKLVDGGDVLDAGVVHEDVHAAKLTRRLRDHRRDFGGLRHVGGAVGGLHPVLGLELGEELVDQRGVAESIQEDVGTIGRERARDAESNAARRARHQRCFAGQHDRFLFDHSQSLQCSRPSSGKGRQTVGIRSPFCWHAVARVRGRSMPSASPVRRVTSAMQVRIKVSDAARFVTVWRAVPGRGMLSRLRRIEKGIGWAASFWMRSSAMALPWRCRASRSL